jgi:membrane-bound lytic murein transglycosylase A
MSKLLFGSAIFCLLLAGSGWSQDVAPIPPIVMDDLDRDSLRRAVRQSLAYLAKLPPDRIVGTEPRPFTAKQLQETLTAFDQTLESWSCWDCWRGQFARQFELVPSSESAEPRDVLFTGYYDPVIDASLAPGADYLYPVYGRPADLAVAEEVTLGSTPRTEKVFGRMDGENFIPYYSRREIDELGMLRGRGYEIAWVKDPIQLFFLHIQGSGVLRLQDGRLLKIGYAGANGRPYRSIGRLLIDAGKIPKEEMSMQRLRTYLTAHPDERTGILNYNESYVFFRFLDDGPLGSLEVPVTAGRSIATDARLFPKGALAFIITQRPVVDAAGELIGWTPFGRFVLNQDSGGAIRGMQRVDLYFGTGDEAAASAGYMNSPGKLYFVSLKKSPAQ